MCRPSTALPSEVFPREQRIGKKRYRGAGPHKNRSLRGPNPEQTTGRGVGFGLLIDLTPIGAY